MPGRAPGGAVSAPAAALHRRLLTLDAHLDTPLHFARPGWRFDERHTVAADLSQLDLPRMAGALDGGFFVVFVPQGPLTPEAYRAATLAAFRRSDAIDAVLARFPDRVGLALTAEDAVRLKAERKAMIFKSMENSYPLGDNLDLLADFHRRGVRLAGAVHARSNQLADSSTDAPLWDGLSPLGQRWVGAMNDLGIVIDGSHASDAALDQMLDLSIAPIILSHSSLRAVFDHPRNIDDGRLRRLVAKGGLLCFSTIFLSALDAGSERLALMRALDGMEELDAAGQAAIAARWQALDATAPMWTADVEDYMAALLRAIEMVGVDGIAFGADFDGGGGLKGLEDVTALPRITARLLAAGISEDELARLWSGNLLRVLAQAQSLAQD